MPITNLTLTAPPEITFPQRAKAYIVKGVCKDGVEYAIVAPPYESKEKAEAQAKYWRSLPHFADAWVEPVRP